MQQKRGVNIFALISCDLMNDSVKIPDLNVICLELPLNILCHRLRLIQVNTLITMILIGVVAFV